MKMWMVFVRKNYRGYEVMCWLPATRTRKEAMEMMEQNNKRPWKELRKYFVIRRVTIEVEY